jgi:hypothetical protein
MNLDDPYLDHGIVANATILGDVGVEKRSREPKFWGLEGVVVREFDVESELATCITATHLSYRWVRVLETVLIILLNDEAVGAEIYQFLIESFLHGQGIFVFYNVSFERTLIRLKENKFYSM